MQNRIIVYLVCVLLTRCTNHKRIERSSPVINKELQVLLDEKEYFKLESKLKAYSDSLTHEDGLYYRSFLENAFNQNEKSLKTIDSLLQNYQLADSIKATLNFLKLDCFFKTFQYAKAAQTDSILLHDYQKFFDKDHLKDIQNKSLIHNGLKNISAQQTDIISNDTINWTRDRLGLIEIPVKCRTKNYSCIFDTRANISSVTESYASRLGLKMLNVSYEESAGGTGIRFKTKMGVADSLYIGNILVRNAVFQVMPDSILYLVRAKIFLNIIIGFPIIEQLREVHIYRDGKMIIPLQPSTSPLHNFALNELDPVISLRTDEDTLSFNFDLGATTTDLYVSFYNKYRSKILREGFKKIVEYGGAGGAQKKEVYILPKLDLYIGNKRSTIDNVSVRTEKIYPSEKFYGNAGQDLVKNFNELILNFKYMYIDAN